MAGCAADDDGKRFSRFRCHGASGKLQRGHTWLARGPRCCITVACASACVGRTSVFRVAGRVTVGGAGRWSGYHSPRHRRLPHSPFASAATNDAATRTSPGRLRGLGAVDM